ncbi:unnamed protein product, partial [Staurois parvus]
LRVPFTGTKGPSSTTEKQPNTIIPPPPYSAQCSQASTILLATAKPRHVHRIARQKSVIWSLQRTCLHCSRVQWRRALHYGIQRFALHLVM